MKMRPVKFDSQIAPNRARGVIATGFGPRAIPSAAGGQESCSEAGGAEQYGDDCCHQIALLVTRYALRSIRREHPNANDDEPSPRQRADSSQNVAHGKLLRRNSRLRVPIQEAAERAPRDGAPRCSSRRAGPPQFRARGGSMEVANRSRVTTQRQTTAPARESRRSLQRVPAHVARHGQ